MRVWVVFLVFIFAFNMCSDDNDAVVKDHGTLDIKSGEDATITNNGNDAIVDHDISGSSESNFDYYADINQNEIELGEGEYPLEKPIKTHGYTFTKTTCPDGLAAPSGNNWLNGKWRYFQEFDVDENGYITKFIPDPKDYFETYVFEGNKFINTLKGDDLGTYTEAKISGYYFCSTKDEMDSKKVIFVLEKVEPEGAFGNHTGDIYPCDVLSNELYNRFLLWCYFDWDLTKGDQYEYAKCKNSECTKF